MVAANICIVCDGLAPTASAMGGVLLLTVRVVLDDIGHHLVMSPCTGQQRQQTQQHRPGGSSDSWG